MYRYVPGNLLVYDKASHTWTACARCTVTLTGAFVVFLLSIGFLFRFYLFFFIGHNIIWTNCVIVDVTMRAYCIVCYSVRIIWSKMYGQSERDHPY